MSFDVYVLDFISFVYGVAHGVCYGLRETRLLDMQGVSLSFSFLSYFFVSILTRVHTHLNESFGAKRTDKEQENRKSQAVESW